MPHFITPSDHSISVHRIFWNNEKVRYKCQLHNGWRGNHTFALVYYSCYLNIKYLIHFHLETYFYPHTMHVKQIIMFIRVY